MASIPSPKPFNGKEMASMLEQEIWKPLKDWEDIYEISTYGRVQRIIDSFKYKKGYILKHADNGNGYLHVSLSRNSMTKNFYVHRLVGVTFLNENSIFQNEINHKDGNKSNNFYKNLEWVTHKENAIHKINILNIGHSENSGNAILKNDKVRDIAKLIFQGKSNKEISNILNINKHHIVNIRNGKVWSRITGISEYFTLPKPNINSIEF